MVKPVCKTLLDYRNFSALMFILPRTSERNRELANQECFNFFAGFFGLPPSRQFQFGGKLQLNAHCRISCCEGIIALKNDSPGSRDIPRKGIVRCRTTNFQMSMSTAGQLLTMGNWWSDK